MNAIDFTRPENVEALKTAGLMLAGAAGFWFLFVKADQVGEASATFLPVINGPVNRTPGFLLKPFGLISLVVCVASGWHLVQLIA